MSSVYVFGEVQAVKMPTSAALQVLRADTQLVRADGHVDLVRRFARAVERTVERALERRRRLVARERERRDEAPRRLLRPGEDRRARSRDRPVVTGRTRILR